MKRSSLLALNAVLVVAACSLNDASNSDSAIASNRSNGGPAAVKPGGHTRHFTLHYEASVKSAPDQAKEVDLWLPVAHDTDFQKVKLTEVTAPSSHEIGVEPTLGNKIFHVRVPVASLPLKVALDFDVERLERCTDLAAALNGAALSPTARAEYLAGTRLVPTGSDVLKLSGFEPKGVDALAVARQAYDHVFAKMRYDKPKDSGWGKGSTEWACKEGFGNCTDFHAYFMSLTRTEKIPSRFTMGLPLPTDAHGGEIPGYHCWAEFFVDGRGWIPVDISEASKAAEKKHSEMVDYYFGSLTPDRVEFSHGRDVVLTPRQAGAPLNFFVYPYCEIDGKEAAKDAVTRAFAFKDV